MNREKRIRDHYGPLVSRFRDGYEMADWSSAEGQRRRFEVLANGVDLNDCDLLDVGCGVGDLYDFLIRRGVKVRYVGVDIVPQVVGEAQRRHPDAEFVLGDIFAADILGDRRFDVTYSSGTFNLNLGNNREFLYRAVHRLFELSRRYVVFNLLHDRVEQKYDQCVYFNPAEVRERLAPLAGEISIYDSYLPNDFTVVCRKREAGESPAASV